MIIYHDEYVKHMLFICEMHRRALALCEKIANPGPKVLFKEKALDVLDTKKKFKK